MYQSSINHNLLKTVSENSMQKKRENTIRQRTIKAIKYYKRGKITLRELVIHAEKIKKQNFQENNGITDILEEICSFSVIDALLNDILHELLEK